MQEQSPSAPAARVLVIVPAWNEEESLPSTIRDIEAAAAADLASYDVDVLVVDDGSGDATARVAAQAGARVCSLPFNLGVGGAMRTGYRYAVRHGYDVAVQLDADGQHDARYLARLLPLVGEADLVIGARFAGEGERYQVSLLRGAAMKVLARTLSRMARTRLTDVTSGYRVANRRAMTLFALHYPAEYLGDTVESLVIAARAGCRIVQEPVTMRARTAGRASHSPIKAAIYLFRAVVALLLALVRDWPAQFDEGMEPSERPAQGGSATGTGAHR